MARSEGVGVQAQPEGGHVGVVSRGWEVEAYSGKGRGAEVERRRREVGWGRNWRMRREMRRGVAGVTIEGDDNCGQTPSVSWSCWLAGLMME